MVIFIHMSYRVDSDMVALNLGTDQGHTDR